MILIPLRGRVMELPLTAAFHSIHKSKMSSNSDSTFGVPSCRCNPDPIRLLSRVQIMSYNQYNDVET